MPRKKPPTPVPAGWKKTIDDLLGELNRGERTEISGTEHEWAWQYTRSLIPAHMRFPKQGDVYEALADTTVDFMTVWFAPSTGGGTGVLKKGERIIVGEGIFDPRPISVCATGVNHAELEKRMVPDKDRKNKRYSNFYFSVTTVDLNTKFRLVQQ